MIFSRLFRSLWSTTLAGALWFGAHALEAAEPPAAIETATLPEPGFAGSIAIDSFRIQASRDLDPAAAASPAAYRVRAAGPNDSWDDSDDTAYAVVPALVDARTVQLTLPVNPLQPGKCRFETTPLLLDDLGRTVAPFSREFAIVHPPAGRIENTENDSLPGATVLPSIETPAGSGFMTGMGQGSFALASDVDYWRFDAEAGDQITLYLEADSPANPRLSLRNSSGQEINSGEGPLGTFNQIQLHLIPASGFYYVMVHAEAAPAQYRLRLDRSKQWPLERESNDAQSAPNNLSWSISPGALHGRIAGALPAQDPYGDCYRLGILNAGNTIRVAPLFPSPSTVDTNTLTMSIESAADGNPLVSQTGGQLNHVTAADGVFFLRISTAAPNLNLRAQYLIEIEVVDGMPPRVISDSLPPSQSSSATLVDRLTIVWNEAVASTINALNQPPWTYGGHAYALTPNSTNWPSAESYAVSLDGHLITLNDPAENDWARRTFGPHAPVWIGLNDAAQEGVFAWTSGDPLSFVHWNTGEPTNSDEEDAVIIAPSGFWSDVSGKESLVGVLEVSGADQDQDGWPNPVDPFPADPLNAVQLISIGPDLTPETADDARYRLVLNPYSGGTQLDFRIADGPLQPGDYRFSVSQSVRDRVGNVIASNFARFFSITNIPNYVLENRDNDVPEGATPLDAFLQAEDPAASGLRTGVGRGNLSSTADVDYWSFAAETGDRLSVVLSNQGGGYSSYGWFWQVIIRDSQGNQLAGFTSDGSGQTAPVVLPAAGIYTVAVSHTFDQIDEYQLRVTLARPPLQLETEDNAHPGIANDLAWTSNAGHQRAAVVGFLWASDTDFHRLGNLAEQTAITVSLTRPATSDLEGVLTLYRNGEPVATNTPSDPHLDYTVPAGASGMYSVAVTGGNGTGGLWAQYLLAIDFADTSPLAVVSVSLPSEGSTSAGILDRLTIVFTKDLQIESANSAANYDLRAWGADGQWDTADDDVYPIVCTGYSGGVSASYLVQGAPLQPGSYRFRVKAGLKDKWGTPMAGDYERRFGVVNATGHVLENRANDTAETATSLAGPLGAEDPAGSGLRTGVGRGNLSSTADVDYWSFEAQEGDRLSVVLANEGGGYPQYGAYWQLNVRDSQGNQLAGFTSDGSGQTTPVVLPAPGIYTVAVSHTFDQIDEYQFRVTLARPPLQLETEDNAHPGIANDLAWTSNAGHQRAAVVGFLWASDTDFHRLGNLADQTAITLSLTQPATSDLEGVLILYRSNEPVATNTPSDTHLHYTIPAGAGGLYSVAVTASNGMGGLWAQYLLELDFADLAPLAVADVSLPIEGSTALLDRLTITFTKDLQAEGAADPASYDLRSAGPDGQFDTADDDVYPILAAGYSGGVIVHSMIQGAPLQPGSYRFRVKASLKDQWGTPMAGDFERRFSVVNLTGYVIENRINDTTETATSLAGPLAAEDPAGSGLRTGVGRGNLSSTADVDYWSFAAETGDRLSVVLSNQGGGYSSYGWFWQVIVRDSQGNQLAGFTSDGSGQTAPVVLPAPGIYTVAVSHTFDHIGEYQVRVTLARPPLQLETEDNAHPGIANDLVWTSSAGHQRAAVVGFLWASDTDFHRLGNLADQTAIALSLTQPATSDLEGVLTLYRSNEPVATNTPPDTHLHYTIPAGAGGLYSVAVTASNGMGGLWAQYLLELDFADQAPLAVADVSLPLEGSTALLDRLTITFTKDLQAQGAANPASYDLRSAGPDGQLDTADDDVYPILAAGYSGGVIVHSMIQGAPLQPGSYRFRVKASLKDQWGTPMAGDFERRFSVVNLTGYVIENRVNDTTETATSLAGPLAAEDPAGSGLRTGVGRGNLSSTADVDYWSFAAETGDRLSVVLSNQGGGYSAYGWFWQVIVRDSQGNQLAGFTSDGSGQTAPVVLPAPGIYTVAVSHTFDQIDEYQVRVTLARPPLQIETEDNGSLGSASPVELAISGDRRIASVAGALWTRVDLDYHRLLALTNGSTVFLSIRASQSSHGPPIVGLYDAVNGYQIEAESGRPFDGVAEVRITQDGDYFALVRAATAMGSAWEPYVLDVQVVPTGTVDFPNLQVAAISAPMGTDYHSGQTVSFSFTVRNAGSHPTPAGPWMDRVVVSTNEVYGDADDLTLGQFEHSGILEPGQGYTVDAQANLPEGLSGACFLIAHADYGNRIAEFVMEGDNDLISTNAFVVQLASYPDLVIEDLHPTPIPGSASLNVSWTLANRGNREASSGFRQRIQIRNLNTGIQTTNVELAVETSLLPGSTLPGIIQCPLDTAGRYRVVVIADSADQIYEFQAGGHAAAEQNNTAESDFDAALDLVVTDLRIEPASGLQSGASIAILWSDRNTGTLPIRGAWQDHLVVSNVSIGETLLDARIPWDTAAAGEIPPGGASARQHSFRLPDGQRGRGVLRVFVQGDVDNQLFEYDPSRDAKQNNAATISATSVLGPYPDLNVGSIQAPSTVILGQGTAISWIVTNQGTAIATAPWTETICLAADATGAQRQELVSIIHSNSLAIGGWLARTQTVLLPAGVYDERFLAVEIDSRAEVFELDETNNTKVAEQGTRLLAADLVVESFTAPSTAQFGQSIPLTWVVKNAGSAAAIATWRDQIWFSTSGALDAARFLQDAPATGVSPLAPGARYTNTAIVAIPLETNPSAGDCFLWLKTDAQGQQPEMDEANNARSSAALALRLPPLPDLAITALLAPSYARPGQIVELSWITTNQGAAAASSPWTETVRMAVDPLSGTAQSLLSITITNPLAPGEFLVQTQRVSVPATAPAKEFYLTVTTDAADAWIEAVETNNLASPTNTTRIASILTLQVPARQIAENALDPILRATVTHNGDPTNSVLVAITNSDPSELTMPDQVTIPAGQNSAAFDMRVVADGIVDGPQTVLVRVDAEAYAGDNTSIAVIDTDVRRLSLAFQKPQIREGEAITVTIRRDEASALPLEVKIGTYYPAQLAVPQKATIPANETSVTFVLEATEDDLLEAATSYDVIATAFGHAQASAPIVIEDNDWPEVRIEIAPLAIAEDAGAQMGIASVTRNVASNRQLVFELESSNPDALWVPNRLAIPAGATRLGFPILPVDDDVVTGARPVTVRAFVMDSTVSVRLFEAIPDTIEIAENDSPALRFTLERSLVAEGLSPATTGTLALNTATNQAVLVTLLSSDTTEAAVPSTVLLPANQESVIFEVHTLQDGIVDGNQTVHLTASATGIQPASATLVVSDRDLPDLVIRHLTFPTNALTEAPISIAYSLANQGLAPASGAWIQKVYLSTDPILDNQDSLLEQQVCSNTIPVSQQIERTITPRLPSLPGDYWIFAVADDSNSLDETIEENNTTIGSVPIRIEPAYTATVETSISQAAAGTPIPVQGRAVRPTGEPAPFVLVYIQVQANGTVRTIEATTDADGRFTAIFTPPPGEAGSYSIGAMHPGMAAAPVQDEFVLLGMRISPADAFHEINALETATGTLELANSSEIPITGLTATIQAASGLSAQVEVAPRLEGSSTTPVRYTVQSLLNESALRSIVIQIASAEGITAEASVTLSLRPLRPQIRVFPDSLEGGMLRGQSAIYRMEIANIGGAATGPLRVVLPDLTWMHVVSANPLPSLEPGQTHPIELQLAPDEDLALGEYSGALAVSGTAVGVSVPYAFRNVSTAIGDLRLTIEDERAYYGQNLTNVAGATIILTDPYTGAVVITGQSDASGQFVVRGLREGAYSLEVSSPKHDMASGSIEIRPGTWTEQRVFLRSQLVRYTWTVEEIEIEDRTRIVLDTTYETAVPVPVVTVEPPFIDLTQVQGNVHQVVLKITNHGLIAAQNMTVDFPDHPRWILTPLITNVGTLPAKTTIEVPLICVRKPAGAMAAQAGGRIQAAGAVSEAASAAGTIGWSVLCGTALIPYNLFMHMVELLDVDVTWVEPPKIQEWTEPRVPRIGRRTLEQLLEDAYYRADIFSTFSQPSLPTLNLGRICQCDPKKFKPACLGGQLGLKFDFESVVNRMVEAATAGWAHVNESHLTLRFQGETCTCCEDYLLGLEGNINAGAEGEISVLIGPRTPDLFTGRVLIPGLGYVRYAAKIEAGFVVGLEARFAGKVDSSCDFGDPEWCVEGYVKGKGGVKAEAKAACILEDPITGKEFGFDANTKIEIMAGGGYFGKDCSNGEKTNKWDWDDLVLTLEVSGEVKMGENEIVKREVKFYAQHLLLKLSSDGAKAAQRFAAAENAFLNTHGPALSMATAPAAFGSPASNRSPLATPAGLSAASSPRLLQSTLLPGSWIPRLNDRNVALAWRPPVPASAAAPHTDAPTELAAAPTRPSATAASQEDVCAKAEIRVEQSAVMTRKAVGATLEVFNETDQALENLSVLISIYDSQGQPADDKFVILSPQLAGIFPAGEIPLDTNGFVTSGEQWLIQPQSSGKARWVILPKDEAAPVEPLQYTVGGAFTYTVGGVPVGRMLLPTPVNVYPNPRLQLKYFLQREVSSDDPFTPEFEPAEPFSLGILVQNAGHGLAKNFSITSAQPKIVENVKGLLVDFDLIGAEINGQTLSPSLQATFGDIGPGEVKVGRWLFTASILGFFVDYKASFEHDSALGGRETSLIESVDIHELIHAVLAGAPFADGQLDFLANDAIDDLNLPETLYLSDGSTNAVSAVLTATVDSVPTPSNATVRIQAVMPPGWSYLRIPDPAQGRYPLARVVRADGREIPVGTNAWITGYTFTESGQRPIRESTLHLLDYNSSGIYDLTYDVPAGPDRTPPSSSVEALPAESVAQFAVQWSGNDEGGSQVAFFDVYVSVNGQPFVPWLLRTTLPGAIYQGVMGNRYAFYCVATDRAGNQEAAPAANDAQTAATLGDAALDFQIQIGTTHLLAGETNSVPIVLASRLGLDRMAFTLTVEPSRLAELRVEPGASELDRIAFEPESANRVRLLFYALPGSALSGTQAIARLSFATDSQTHSAVVRLIPSDPSGVSSAGENVRQASGTGGRVFLIGREPLLDMPAPNTVRLYGRPGALYRIETTPHLDGASWTPLALAALRNRFADVAIAPAQDPQMFLRGIELEPALPWLEIHSAPPILKLHGTTNTTYELLRATNLLGPWLPAGTILFTNSILERPWSSQGDPALFFRLLRK